MTNNFPHRPLSKWPEPLKVFLISFLLLLTCGVSVGLFYLFTTTSFSPTGTIEHYKGSTITADSLLDFPEKYAKPASELLLTTHNHVIGFSFIFFILCGLFYFNSTISGRLKNFLLVEPFISTWLTFASIWGLKYIDTYFVYLTFMAALLTYSSFFFLVIILLYELRYKKKH